MDTYEEKYNEALEKARQLCVYPTSKPFIRDLQDIFPELKESEDERIRKGLIDFVNQYGDNFYGQISKEHAIAWLEKQGEQKHQYKSRPRYVGEEELLGANKQGEQILANIAKTCKDEQKPNPYSGTSFDYDGHTWGMCARDNGVELLLDGELKAFLSLEKSFIYPIHPQPELAPKSALEAAKEEKADNANKVEPKDYNDIDPHFGKPIDKVVQKFKVGDWVIFNEHHNSVYQVEKIQDLRYYLRHYTGGSMSVHIDNQLIRHWTIQDAKDGDVLKEGSCIFILRKMKSKNTAITHCCLFDDGDFNLSPTLSLDVDSTFPATKEQRDILFAKMKEEGYVWDAKKKEPKKIEQPKLTEFEDAIKDMMDDYRDAIDDNDATVEEVKERAAYLLSLIPQKPAAWSDEDEDILRTIISDGIIRADLDMQQIDWLKSLKNRVFPQPKQEWSEEDEKYVKDLADYFTGGLSLKHAEEEIADWLESLKDRYTWKPSDEQIGALEHFVRNITESGFASPYDSNTKLVYSLLNDLKKTKIIKL